VYGLIAVMTGAESNFAQLSLYIYSVLGLVALSWGLKSIKDVCRSSTVLDLQLTSSLFDRKTLSTHSILRTSSSSITSSQQLGQYSSPLSGGLIPRMMGSKFPIHMRRRPYGMMHQL
jgi:hypothetical protein